MGINKAQVKNLLRLARGETVARSILRGEWVEQMLEDGVLMCITHGSKKSYRAVNTASFRRYLAATHEIYNLELLDEEYHSGETRAGLVHATGDSKYDTRPSFPGFHINCYEPLSVEIAGEEYTLHPHEGLCHHIFDYKTFKVSSDYVIVGVENAENFRMVVRQRAFFERELGKCKFLFVSRYPQKKGNALANWLKSITNRYVHFGDLDLAGISIFQNEFLPHMGNRASFLVPTDYEQRIQRGSHERWAVQEPRYRNLQASSPQIQLLMDCINRYRRGYDQEGFIE